jgi:hypothetical protein
MNVTDRWKPEIRRDMISSYALDLAEQAGEQKHFLESQAWPGYDKAFQSWADSIWRWIDSGISAETENLWRQKLWATFAKTSPNDNDKQAALKDYERGIQEHIFKRAEFMDGLRHKKEGDSNWFKQVAYVFYCASLIDDDKVFEELARLTSRKSSQSVKGRRSLRGWLLRLWIPGCFWAMTNAGISKQICIYASRKQKERFGTTTDSDILRYSEGRIKNVISELKLWRPSKPLYRIDENGHWIFRRQSPVTKLTQVIAR